MRPMGLAASAAATNSGCAPITRWKAALLAAGHTAFTTTPVGAHSRAAVRVRVRNDSLATLYSRVPMWAFTPLREHMLMTRPQPFAFMRGKHSRMAQNAAKKPMSSPCRRTSFDFFSTRPIIPPPQALFTSTSMGPSRSAVVAITPTISDSFVTSARTNAALSA